MLAKRQFSLLKGFYVKCLRSEIYQLLYHISRRFKADVFRTYEQRFFVLKMVLW